MEDTLIRFENVSYRYESDTDTPLPLAVDGVNLDIHKGEFCAILGHNGSGKSTLAKLSNGIAVPEKGTVTVKGMNTQDEKNDIKIKQTVGVVFQNPDNQIIATVVEEDVAFGPENLGIAPEEIRKRVDDSLKAVGMYEYRFHEPHKLSGGQKQRVAIAGIIAMQTECIVLDEPTAMLDPAGRRDVMNVLKELNKQLGITIVLITHFMNEAVQADRVVIMNKGKKIADGKPEFIFGDDKLITDNGLEMPQSKRIVLDLRKKGINLSDNILTAEQFVNSVENYISGGVI